MEVDISGARPEGVFMTFRGNQLILHRNSNDGPPDEIVLECPTEYDLSLATAEVQYALFRIKLPRRAGWKAKKLASLLTEKMIGSAAKMNMIKAAPWGRFSQN